MGRLRESRNGAKRADLIVVTKCPETAFDLKKKELKEKIKQYNNVSPIIFSSIGYGKPYPLKAGSNFSQNVVLLSGIANDNQLKDYVSNNFNLLEVLKFPDHHEYVGSDFQKLKQLFLKYSDINPVVITTEKDSVKVKSNSPAGFLAEIPIFVLPIQVVFSLEDERIIDSLIEQVILQKK
jgi:tetraacyldisaccharide 4'-kinase